MRMFSMKTIVAGLCVILLTFSLSAQGFILQDPPSGEMKFGLQFMPPLVVGVKLDIVLN